MSRECNLRRGRRDWGTVVPIEAVSLRRLPTTPPAAGGVVAGDIEATIRYQSWPVPAWEPNPFIGWRDVPRPGNAAVEVGAGQYRQRVGGRWKNRDTTSPVGQSAFGLRVVTGAAGSQTLTVVPWPSSLSMSNCPRWRLTMCLTIANPNPVPPTARDRPLSTR